MNAAVVRELGKPPRCEQFPEPVASENEVIVHVHAAALKPVDKQMAGGSHYAAPRIRLDVSARDLQDAFVHEAGESGFQVVIDYVWGPPTQAFLAAITSTKFAAIRTETRLIQAGESAGPTILLPAAVLRSTALTILGTAGIPPRSVLADALQRVMTYAANGELQVETTSVPLAEIESAWERGQPGRRIVIIP